MSGFKEQVEHMLNQKCPLLTLSELMSMINVSAENRAELEDIVGMLEIHESELRSVRQSLSLRLRQYTLEYYSDFLRSRVSE